MREEQFNTYRFGINTEVLWNGEWQKLHEVWFEEGKVGLRETGQLIDYHEVQDIRESV
jgi:hypothetical protein